MLQYISKLLYVLSESQKKLLLLILIFLTTSILEALGIGLVGPFLNLAAYPDSVHKIAFLEWLYQYYNFQSSAQFLFVLGLFIVFVFCIKSVTYFLSKWYIFKFTFDHQTLITNRLMNAYLFMPYSLYLNRNTASLIKNIVIEVNHFTFMCLLPFLEVIINFVITAALVILLAKTSLIFLVASMSLLLPIFFLFNNLGKHFEGWGEVSSKAQQSIMSAVNHGLGGFKETRIIGCESYFGDQVELAAHKYARSSTLFQSFQILPRILIETFMVVFLVLTVSVSIILLKNNFQDLISVLGVFAIAGMRLVPTASTFFQSLAKLRNGTYALDVLYLDLKEQERNGLNSATNMHIPISHIPSNRKSIFFDKVEVNNITYRYPNAPKVAIDNLSISFKKGQSIAFIGKSGSGKTTLADIILGLLQPEAGDIYVDGVSIYRDLRAWQNLIGYIPQSIFLSDDTIEHNIAFGVPDHLIEAPKMQRAINAAQLEELIDQLPDGIATKVGERGIRLSGGQRQRIGIARALYHEREILVLDEATSALDSETEQLVGQSIDSLAGEKTLIIIAHRLSTIERCDCVYRLDGGRIVKSGKFEEIVTTTS